MPMQEVQNRQRMASLLDSLERMLIRKALEEGRIAPVIDVHCMDERHRVIVAALCRIGRWGQPVDLVSLIDELVVHGEIDRAGGREYVATLLKRA